MRLGRALAAAGVFVFMKIAEPRVVRLIQFGIYGCMIAAGTLVLLGPPRSFEGVLGEVLVYTFGGFLTLGGVCAAFAVLPGIWWVERIGILALGTAMCMYTVVTIALGASPMGVVIGLAFLGTFIIRWMEIRRYQLAPRIE
jgi:hypothetical protein